VPRTTFITPSAPILRRDPPTGPEWLHEVKHDGWRAQLHKTGDAVTIYTRRGNDVTQGFRSVAEAVARLPARSIIIDAEIIACDANGAPDFYALTRRAPHGCCAYCFDLLELDGTAYDMMGLVERRSPLRRLLKRGDGDMLRLSEVFDDPQALLAACEKRGLEGIVLKLRNERYRSGKNPG
jgi:bifunctional non-homologous end joining protein LigD